MTLADPKQSSPSRVAQYVAGGVLLLVLVAGSVSIAWGVLNGDIKFKASNWSLLDIMSGESALHLAQELTAAPLPKALADAERGASWLVTGSLGSRVRRGCGPWLFLEDELVVHPNAAANAQRRLDAVVKVRDLMHNKGVNLIVTTVPDKSRVQNEQLCGVYRPASSGDRLRQWEAGLAQHGIQHASLLPALEAVQRNGAEQPFLATDTHWTQRGAHAAANAVAQAMDPLKINLTPKQSYVAAYGQKTAREGDLVRLAGIDWLPSPLKPSPDMERSVSFRLDESREDNAGSTQTGDAANALFGDDNLPSVALIGTSYSRTSSFVPFLEEALETPVPSFALDGGDFWGAAKDYLASSEYRDTPPRVVIWELPERVLQMPVSEEERAWIQSLEQKEGPKKD